MKGKRKNDINVEGSGEMKRLTQNLKVEMKRLQVGLDSGIK